MCNCVHPCAYWGKRTQHIADGSDSLMVECSSTVHHTRISNHSLEHMIEYSKGKQLICHDSLQAKECEFATSALACYCQNGLILCMLKECLIVQNGKD